MSTFTVHVPPGVADEAARADRTVFVREGFDWGAFLTGPLALLMRGLWRASLAWALTAAALLALSAAFGLGGGPRLILYLVLATITGLEAAEARRRALGRSGFIPAALLGAATRDAAERRFFGGPAPLSAPIAPSPGSGARGGRRTAIIGLFPAPGGRA